MIIRSQFLSQVLKETLILIKIKQWDVSWPQTTRRCIPIINECSSSLEKKRIYKEQTHRNSRIYIRESIYISIFPFKISFYRWGHSGCWCLKRDLFNIESKPAAWISNNAGAYFRAGLQQTKINVDGCVASCCVQASMMVRMAALECTLAAAAAATCECGRKRNADWHQFLCRSKLWWIIECQLRAHLFSLSLFSCLFAFITGSWRCKIHQMHVFSMPF